MATNSPQTVRKLASTGHNLVTSGRKLVTRSSTSGHRLVTHSSHIGQKWSQALANSSQIGHGRSQTRHILIGPKWPQTRHKPITSCRKLIRGWRQTGHKLVRICPQTCHRPQVVATRRKLATNWSQVEANSSPAANPSQIGHKLAASGHKLATKCSRIGHTSVTNLSKAVAHRRSPLEDFVNLPPGCGMLICCSQGTHRAPIAAAALMMRGLAEA